MKQREITVALLCPRQTLWEPMYHDDEWCIYLIGRLHLHAKIKSGRSFNVPGPKGFRLCYCQERNTSRSH